LDELINPAKEELAARTLKEYLGESYELFMLIKNLKSRITCRHASLTI